MRKLAFLTAQFADLSLRQVIEMAAEWGYDALEVANFGGHFSADKLLASPEYRSEWLEEFSRRGIEPVAIGAHPLGQAISDSIIDDRHQAILSADVWGDGKPADVRKRAADAMIRLGEAASTVGVRTIVGFSGSPHWHAIAGFPPVPENFVEDGIMTFVEQWTPILDAFKELNVRYALEVHPGQVAFDYWSTRDILDALDWRPEFGINFDPGHLHWQRIDLYGFLQDFAERIYHVHVKEATTHLNGRNGVLAGLMQFGDLRRGWDFAAVGHGDLNWERIIRTLNGVNYEGPLSVEWDDAHMQRDDAVREAAGRLRAASVEPTGGGFQAVFGREESA